MVGSPGGAPGPWVDFPVDPGWTGVTLRQRLTGGGTSLQFDGFASGALTANARARLGILSAGMWPARVQRIPGILTAGIATVGLALVELQPDGAVYTIWTIGSSETAHTLAIAAIVALD